MLEDENPYTFNYDGEGGWELSADGHRIWACGEAALNAILRGSPLYRLSAILDEANALDGGDQDDIVAEIDKAFYELAIKERDYERVRYDRVEGEMRLLVAQNRRLTDALNLIADLVGPEIDPDRIMDDPVDQLLYDIQKALVF